jgi:hypothetical protein
MTRAGCTGGRHLDPDVLGLADTAPRVGRFATIADSEKFVFESTGSQGNDPERTKGKSVGSGQGW